MISEFTDPEKKSLRVGEVNFYAREADYACLQRLPRPAITVAGQPYPVTVTVAAYGAESIYYTMDGSHPYPLNPTAQQYNAPVQVQVASLFRARAFAPTAGKIASDTAAINV